MSIEAELPQKYTNMCLIIVHNLSHSRLVKEVNARECKCANIPHCKQCELYSRWKLRLEFLYEEVNHNTAIIAVPIVNCKKKQKTKNMNLTIPNMRV